MLGFDGLVSRRPIPRRPPTKPSPGGVDVVDILSPATTQTVHMPFDMVAVRDTFLTAGVPVSISATPSTPEQNPRLFLIGDDPGNAATFVRSRFSAVASGAVNGPGVAESLSFTPTVSGWYGVVITNRHGVGDYTLTRS